MEGVNDDPLLEARARALHDLEVRGLADATSVSVLEEAVSQRRWWLAQWEQGVGFVAGLVAQDVQDELFDSGVRWPRCTSCDQTAIHSLILEPELDPDPHWVCGESGIEVATLGQLH
jgi:hypothetical protein